jgi:hypothetical protein
VIIIGLLLIILAAAVGTLLFVGTQQITDTTDINVFGGTLGLPPLALLTFSLTISVFWLGWAMLRGIRRSRGAQKPKKPPAKHRGPQTQNENAAGVRERERHGRERRRRRKPLGCVSSGRAGHRTTRHRRDSGPGCRQTI